MIVIVDYGMGNLGSIRNMLKKVGADSQMTSDPESILRAEKIILPGVGAFDHGMQQLKKLNCLEILRQKVVQEKVSCLGICLGMQLFMEKSEEGVLPGLGWLKGQVKKFKFDNGETPLRVPHMGWNSVRVAKRHPLFEGLEQPRFYFVHSYHVVCENPEDVLGKTEYGYPFVSSIGKENIWGAQFHPEKSHKFGMRLFQNFVRV